MPEDLMDTYCRRICGKLRDTINGGVWVYPLPEDPDVIIVKINWCDIKFKYYVRDMAWQIQHGISSNQITAEIIARFKEIVLSAVFK